MQRDRGLGSITAAPGEITESSLGSKQQLDGVR